MNISSIDSTMRLNATFAAQRNKTSGTNVDPATMADKILQNGIRSKDTDGDGSLSSSELGELSQDTFGTLDADGDGKLNTDELKNAIQTHLEEMRKATEDGEAKTAKDLLDQLTATPEGQLMQALSPEKSSSAQTSTTSSSAAHQLNEILAGLKAQSSDTDSETTARLNLTA